jgi:hypothetical protein
MGITGIEEIAGTLGTEETEEIVTTLVTKETNGGGIKLDK